MKKILVVDDERSINDLIVMNLKLSGYECLQAFDGGQAENLAKAENPDLIILDIMLPVYDGFTLMEKRMFGDIPVIYLSAKDQLTDKVRGLTAGADDYRRTFSPFAGFVVIFQDVPGKLRFLFRLLESH